MTRCTPRPARPGPTTGPCRTGWRPWAPPNWPNASRRWSGSFLLQGITFTVYGAESSTEQIIPTDLFPRIIGAAEWDKIEQGLIQRLRALNLFLADIYGDQKILADGIVPRDLVLGAPSYRRQMQHLYVPHQAYVNVCGSDLIRGVRPAEFFVLEDNLRVPSGVSYMLANRDASRRTFPGTFRKARACGRWSATPTCCCRP